MTADGDARSVNIYGVSRRPGSAISRGNVLFLAVSSSPSAPAYPAFLFHCYHEAAQQRLQAQRYGYVRVAAGERDVEDVQRDALTAAGCVRVWCERPPAVAPARRGPELEQLLGHLRARDVLVVWRLERLAPRAVELADITAQLSARAIGLCSVAEHRR